MIQPKLKGYYTVNIEFGRGYCDSDNSTGTSVDTLVDSVSQSSAKAIAQD